MPTLAPLYFPSKATIGAFGRYFCPMTAKMPLPELIQRCRDANVNLLSIRFSYDEELGEELYAFEEGDSRPGWLDAHEIGQVEADDPHAYIAWQRYAADRMDTGQNLADIRRSNPELADRLDKFDRPYRTDALLVDAHKIHQMTESQRDRVAKLLPKFEAMEAKLQREGRISRIASSATMAAGVILTILGATTGIVGVGLGIGVMFASIPVFTLTGMGGPDR